MEIKLQMRGKKLILSQRQDCIHKQFYYTYVCHCQNKNERLYATSYGISYQSPPKNLVLFRCQV